MPQQTEQKLQQATARTIEATEVHRRLEAEEDLLLVDLMPPSQYLLIHIPGAINIPLDYLHDVLEYLPQHKDIILYCTDEKCEFSEIGARKLALHGFTNVLVIPGGMAEWEAAGFPFATVLLQPDEESHYHHHSKAAPPAQ
jgi:rhodanese-related sulfurtransferase